MFSKFKPSKNKLYINIFLTLVVCVALTVLLLSSILYYNFENIGLNITQSYTQDSLSQVCYSADFMTNSAKNLASQIFFDSSFSSIMYNSSPDIIEINRSLAKYKSYRSSMPYIVSISLYNKASNTLYSSGALGNLVETNDFQTDKELIKIIGDYKNYKILMPIPRKILVGYSDIKLTPIYKNVYTYLFYDLQQNNTDPDNILILNLSESYLRNTIDIMDKKATNTFIINSKGIKIISNKNSDMLTDVSNEKYVQTVLSSHEQSGYFKTSIGGSEFLITYVSSGTLDWKFIRITPYENILNQIAKMKKTTAFVSLSLLLIGVLIYIPLTNKLYTPIDHLQNKLKKLELAKRNSMYTLKQDFLRNLIKTENVLDSKIITANFQEHHIELNVQEHVLMILFRIGHFTEFCNQNNHNDRSLLRFSICNIINELSSQSFTSECVDMNEDHIVLLININQETEILSTDILDKLLLEIQEAVLLHLKIFLSCTISSTSNFNEGLFILYNEVLDASQYRMFHGLSSIIYATKINEESLESENYLIQNEELLIESLNAKDLDVAKETYTQIVMNASKDSYTAFYSTVMHIAFSVNKLITTIRLNRDIVFPYSFNAFLKKLNESETLDEINTHFFELFELINIKLNEKIAVRHEELGKKIIDYIKTSYTDPMISVQSIASFVDMSPVYLGRLFKSLGGKSIPDYILELRMQKAQELLISTNQSIDKISKQVGYTSGSYFHKAFKKYYTLTPNEFREK